MEPVRTGAYGRGSWGSAVSTVVVVGEAVASAAAAATSSVLQHRSARRAPHHVGHRLLGHLLTRPVWLAGLAAAGVGLVLHTVALAGGDLALVQPLLISGVVFALPASALLENRRPSVTECLWALLLVTGLTMFLLAARPSRGWVNLDADVLAIVTLASCGVVGLTALAGWRWLSRHRALVFGLAAGLGYGVTAALLKQTVAVGSHGVVSLLTDWPLYGLVLLGGASLVLTQLAYRAGPLARSMPVLTFADPAVSIVVGACAFHELLANDPVAILSEIAGLVLTAVAATQLARRSHPVPVTA